MAEQLRPYMCKYFKWTSWNHYGVKMPEYACKLKGGVMGSCGGICKKFERKDGTDNDLIDRAALLADIEESVVFSGRPGQNAEICGANKIINRIKAAPEVDAVEVVRKPIK